MGGAMLDQETKDNWIVKFLSKYADIKLREKYHPNKKENFISTLSIEYDKRRCNTVRNFLTKMNVIGGSAFSKNNGYYFDGNYPLQVIEIEKLLKEYATEPVIKLNYRDTKDPYSYQTPKPVTNIGELYIPLTKITEQEHLYIYLHQEEFDIKVFTFHPKKTRYESLEVRETLKVFPLKQKESAIENILKVNSRKYAMDNTKDVLTSLYKCKFKAIDDGVYLLNKKSIADHILRTEDEFKKLKRQIGELKVLQRKITDEDKFAEELVMEASNMLHDLAPIWMSDEAKSPLVKMILEGASTVVTDTYS
jgi:hypothetical protein